MSTHHTNEGSARPLYPGEEDEAPPARHLSLRGVICLISVLLVVAVASATLGITSSTTVATLRDLGKSQARALLASVTVKTVGMFETTIRNLETVRNLTAALELRNPSDDPAAFQYYDRALWQSWQQTRFVDAGVLIYFWDNTRISYSQWNESHTLRSTVLPSPASVDGVYNQTFTGERELIDNSNTLPNASVPFIAGLDYQTVGSTLGRTLLTVTASGRTESIMGYVVRSSLDSRGTLTDHYLALAMPIFNRSVSASQRGSDTLYGIAMASIYIHDINRFLKESRVTPGTAAFALDSGGFLFGSSLDTPFITETDVPDGALATVRGCATAHAIGALSTGPNVQVCRASRATYGYGPLAAIPARYVDNSEDYVALFDHEGEHYYYSSAQVPLRMPGMRIQLVLFMPEADVIGDIIASRNAAIGLTAVLVVIAGIINFVAVSVLLRPLTSIAERMVKASNFEDDDEDESVSAMAEVAELQEAYYGMNEELNRISAFVPQSVLEAKKNIKAAAKGHGGEGAAAGDGAEEDEDYDPDLEEDVPRCSSSYELGDQRGASGATLDNSRSGGRNGSLSKSLSALNASGGSGGHSSGRLQRHRSQDEQSMASRSSRSRSTSIFRRGPGGVPMRAPAATDVQLRPSQTSILVANACGTLQHIANAATRDDATGHISDLVQFVNATVADNGGVIASYHGDHFVATYNAVKPCGGHASAAARTALSLRDGVDAVGFGNELRIGVATGRCLVGSLGCKGLKSFSVVGPAFNHASVLERMCRLYGNDMVSGLSGTIALAPRRTCSDIATQVRFRYVDIVQLPGRDRGPGMTIASVGVLLSLVNNNGADGGTKGGTASGPASGGASPVKGSPRKNDGNDDEWLYVVGGNAAGDENGLWNEAFVKMEQKTTRALEDAVAMLDEYDKECPPSNTATGLSGYGDARGSILLSTDLTTSGGGAKTSAGPFASPNALTSGASDDSSPTTLLKSVAGSPVLGLSSGGGAAAGADGSAPTSSPHIASKEERHRARKLAAIKDHSSRFTDLGMFYSAVYES